MTSFSDIYDYNNLIRNTPSFSNYDDYSISKIMFGYLKFAISLFMYHCAVDLQDRTDPVYTEFDATGTGTEKNFILPTEPESTENIDVWVGSSLVTDYAYDPESLTLSFTTAPGAGVAIKAQFYSCGFFTDSLDEREIHILSEGMLVPYLERFKNDENALKYIISGSSLKFYSQANHIDSTKRAADQQQREVVNGLIMDYTYMRNIANYSDLVG